MSRILDNHYSLICVLKDIVKEVFKFTHNNFLRSPELRRMASKEVFPEGLPKCYTELRPMEDKDLQDQSRKIDVETERFILELLGLKLQQIGIEDFIVQTEERGIIAYSKNESSYNEPIYILNIDPIDSTDLAISRLGGAVSISVGFMDGNSTEIVAAVVGDLASRDIYWAYKEEDDAFIDFEENFNSRRTEIINPNVDVKFNKIKLSSFAAKIKRFKDFSSKKVLISMLDENDARIFQHMGGPLPICLVSSGDIDAVFDLIKGYKFIDYGGALFIAEKAGAKVQFLDNNLKIQNKKASQLYINSGCTFEDSLLKTLKKRQKFIVAANLTIINAILLVNYFEQTINDEEDMKNLTQKYQLLLDDVHEIAGSIKLKINSLQNKYIELIDPKTCKRNSKIKVYQKVHMDGDWHGTVHVIAISPDGRLLIQVRGKNDNRYDISVSGHVDIGETPDQGSIREIKEELNLKEVVPLRLIRIGQYKKVGKSSIEKDRYDSKNKIYFGPSKHIYNREVCNLYVYKLIQLEVDKILEADKKRTKDDELKSVKFIYLKDELPNLYSNPNVYASGFNQYFKFDKIRSEVLKKISKHVKINLL